MIDYHAVSDIDVPKFFVIRISPSMGEFGNIGEISEAMDLLADYLDGLFFDVPEGFPDCRKWLAWYGFWRLESRSRLASRRDLTSGESVNLPSGFKFSSDSF
jgi:hypothetical protein